MKSISLPTERTFPNFIRDIIKFNDDIPYYLISATLAIYAAPLPILLTTVYLVIRLVSTLLWSAHVNKLLTSVNFLEMLSSPQWKGDPSFLILFYKTIILSELEYKFSLYDSVSKIHVQICDLIGALNSTPVREISAEIRLPSQLSRPPPPLSLSLSLCSYHHHVPTDIYIIFSC